MSKAKPPGAPKPKPERRRQPRRAADKTGAAAAPSADEARAVAARPSLSVAPDSPPAAASDSPPAAAAEPHPFSLPQQVAAEIQEAPEAAPRVGALREFLRQPELVDEGRLRFGLTVVLAAAGIYFFRTAAVGPLLATLAGAGIALGIVHVGFHRVGLRALGAYWPGFLRGMATGLLFFCVCPPSVPLAAVFLLSGLAVLLEGLQRRLLLPLALTGVMVAWLIAWGLHGQVQPAFVRPFDLRPLDEPIALFNRFGEQFGQATDPGRLYTGNVAGLLGATSFGLAAISVAVLAYARKVSWQFPAAFFITLGVIAVATHRPLGLELVSGPGMVFAGLVAAETRRLPRPLAWRAGTGAVAGATAGVLLSRQMGLEAYGFAVVTTSALVALFQFFGLAGSPGHVAAATAPVPEPAEDLPPARISAPQLVILALVAPLGLLLLQRDNSLPRGQRRSLLVLGLAVYALSVGGSLLWLWALRYPV